LHVPFQADPREIARVLDVCLVHFRSTFGHPTIYPEPKSLVIHGL